ncbi:MAG TPA: AI-2E family transporter [Polyangiaceae bacterium]
MSASPQRRALSALLVLGFLAAAWVAAPLYAGLLLGTVMAFTAHPLFAWLTARFHRRRSLAALVTTVLGGTLMLGGGGVVVFVVVREITSLARIIQTRLAGATFDSLVGHRGAAVLEALHVDQAKLLEHLQAQLGALSGEAATAAGLVLSATTSALLTTLIALFTMYYVILEWPSLSLRMERVLPLDPAHTRALVAEFREVARTAFVGTIATGIVQGMLAGIGFTIVGVPQAVTWGVLTIIASFVPVFGTALIWVPVAAYLFLGGRPAAGIFVVFWGLGVVMAVSDYVIRPRLVGGKREGHPLLMLVGLLGGIEVFGITGLIVGPVIMSLFVAILRIYEEGAEPVRPAGTLREGETGSSER